MALKHLILLRHAKSSWSTGRDDHGRPLNTRGIDAAKAIGKVLRVQNLSPNHIWSSDSVRTRETVAGLEACVENTEIEYMPELYHAPANKVLYMCEQKGEPSAGVLMLVGHNPGWEELLYYFSGIAKHMPTGGCAIFSRTEKGLHTKAHWLDQQSWILADFIRPKDITVS